jgi:transposase
MLGTTGAERSSNQDDVSRHLRDLSTPCLLRRSRLYPLAPKPAALTRAYPSSLTDAEWAVLAPLVQRPASPQGGRPPKYPLRQIIDAIRYLVRSGCAWRLLPHDFPPPGHGVLVVCQVGRRRHPGTHPRHAARAGPHPGQPHAGTDRRDHRLPVGAGGRHGPPTKPWVGCRQEGQRPQAVPGCGHPGVGAGGRGHRRLCARPRRRPAAVVAPALGVSGVRLVWADGGYAGKLVAWATGVLRLTVEIVRKRPGQSTFEVLPRRWVVERTLAWIAKHRRTVRDHERLPTITPRWSPGRWSR